MEPWPLWDRAARAARVCKQVLVAPGSSGLFINGLPVATFELKNSLTKQTVEDAVEQYKRDRAPREKLFEFGRCAAHFAVDSARAIATRCCNGMRPFERPRQVLEKSLRAPRVLRVPCLVQSALDTGAGALRQVSEHVSALVQRDTAG